MTVKDLYNVSPQNFIFIREGEKVKEYQGEKYGNDLLVDRILATSYPNYKNVIEVITQ